LTGSIRIHYLGQIMTDKRDTFAKLIAIIYQNDKKNILTKSQRLLIEKKYQEHYTKVGTLDELYARVPEVACLISKMRAGRTAAWDP